MLARGDQAPDVACTQKTTPLRYTFTADDLGASIGTGRALSAGVKESH